jgi:plasmid stabilization system protein ParE
MKQILLSDLAVEQLKGMPPQAGRRMLAALQRLRLFPESAPRLTLAGYTNYRQLVVRPYQAIYRFLPEEDQVRVYCILHARRRLPAPEFLQYQTF